MCWNRQVFSMWHVCINKTINFSLIWFWCEFFFSLVCDWIPPRLHTGWSIHTFQSERQRKAQTIKKTELDLIMSVIHRAEQLELIEQHRIGWDFITLHHICAFSCLVLSSQINTLSLMFDVNSEFKGIKILIAQKTIIDIVRLA